MHLVSLILTQNILGFSQADDSTSQDSLSCADSSPCIGIGLLYFSLRYISFDYGNKYIVLSKVK